MLGYKVNHKVVQRLHQEWDLLLIRGTRPPKSSGILKAVTAAGDQINLVAGREMIQAFEVVYADFTELVYTNGRRKAHLIPILDPTSKLVLGCAVCDRAVTSLALEALDQARDALRYQGVILKRVTVHHDQDPVFIGYGWIAELLLKDHVRHPTPSTEPGIIRKWKFSTVDSRQKTDLFYLITRYWRNSKLSCQKGELITTMNGDIHRLLIKHL